MPRAVVGFGAALTGGRLLAKPRRAPTPCGRDEADRRLILALAAAWSGLHVEALAGGARGDAHLSRARHLACYLGHVGLGLSRARVARLVGRDRSSVSYACARIEAERDEPDFDRAVGVLETAAQFATWRGDPA